MKQPTEFAAVRRKFLVGLFALVVFTIGVASPIYANAWLRAHPDRGMAVFVLSMLGALASLAYLLLAVRCPRCGYRLFANAFRREPFGSVIAATVSGCPACGLG